MNDLDRLCAQVCDANRAIAALGLAPLTWGNVSVVTPDRRHVAIKPSGVAYDALTPDQIVVVDLDARVVRGTFKPSIDTPTHIELYRAFPSAGAVVHVHSPHATMFAQARREIPCLGTTHADHFAGPVPVTRPLAPAEMNDYERNTGRVIVERFRALDASRTPGVLVSGHAPFIWGPDIDRALANAVALEQIARIAAGTLAIDRHAPVLEPHILAKHHDRKHGPAKYYGQP